VNAATLEQLREGQLDGARQLKLACGLSEFPREIFDLADTTRCSICRAMLSHRCRTTCNGCVVRAFGCLLEEHPQPSAVEADDRAAGFS
jgi:hypothetical protein